MPDDPWFDEIEPMLYHLMYEHWICDIKEKNEFAKNYSILVGSFTNHEMAKAMLDEETGSNTLASSSDEDFEESQRMVLRDRDKKLRPKGKRKMKFRKIVE